MDSLIRDLLMDCIDEFGFEKNIWFNLGIVADKLEDEGFDYNTIIGLRYGHQHRKYPSVDRHNPIMWRWSRGTLGEWNAHNEIESRLYERIRPVFCFAEPDNSNLVGCILELYRGLGVALSEKLSRENNVDSAL